MEKADRRIEELDAKEWIICEIGQKECVGTMRQFIEQDTYAIKIVVQIEMSDRINDRLKFNANHFKWTLGKRLLENSGYRGIPHDLTDHQK